MLVLVLVPVPVPVAVLVLVLARRRRRPCRPRPHPRRRPMGRRGAVRRDLESCRRERTSERAKRAHAAFPRLRVRVAHSTFLSLKNTQKQTNTNIRRALVGGGRSRHGRRR